MAEFISLYSGSSGNCSVVRCGGSYLLVDMGKGVRVTTGALREAGLEAADCGGILITHEHSDHVKGLATFLKRHQLPVYGAQATIEALEAAGILPAGCPVCVLDPASGEMADVAGFGVRAFPTSHDVPCVGYRIAAPDGKTMTIATDLGVLTPAVHAALAGCDLVALESNYDPYMPQRAVSLLLTGPHRRAPGAPFQRRVQRKAAGTGAGRVRKVRAVPPFAGEQHPAPGAADRLYHVRGGGGGAGPGLHRPDPAPQ